MHVTLLPRAATPVPPARIRFGAATPGDVVCVGSMVRDVFVQLPPQHTGEGELAPGVKMDTPNTFEQRIGGGAVNATMSFKKLGYNPMPLSRIADDNTGRMIRNALKTAGIDLRMLQVQPTYTSVLYRLLAAIEHFLGQAEPWVEKISGQPIPGFMLVNNDALRDGEKAMARTGESVILNRENGDRTVVTYRGVSNQLCLEEVNWDALAQASGLYIANFGSEDPGFLESLVTKARQLNPHLRIAFNPGGQQLRRGLTGLAPVLRQIDILNLNLEEARLLLNGHAPPDAPVQTMLKALWQAGPKVVVITDGRRGAYAFDGSRMDAQPAYPVPFKSTLGAGDAFGSTFMAYYMEDPARIGRALQYASAHAASVVTQVGAQAGLLSRAELESWVNRLEHEHPAAKPA